MTLDGLLSGDWLCRNLHISRQEVIPIKQVVLRAPDADSITSCYAMITLCDLAFALGKP
jgi:hypothetical protein